MSARENILNKLRHSLTGATPIADTFDEDLVTTPWSYAPELRIAQLHKLMEAVHTEIHLSTESAWPELLGKLVSDRQLPSLLIAPGTPHGRRVTEHWSIHPNCRRLRLTTGRSRSGKPSCSMTPPPVSPPPWARLPRRAA